MQKPNKMSEGDLVQVINSLETSAISYREEFMSENEELLRRYNGEPYGDEDEDRSQVISTDVHDLVYADMTSLVRVFLGSGDVMVFEPASRNPIDVQEAKDKTAVINHIIRKRKDSYKVNYAWLLDTEVQKMGVVYYYMDDETSTKEVKYSNVSLEEIQEIEEELKEDAKVKELEIVEQEERESQDDEEAAYNVTFRVTSRKQEIKIENIPTEDFLLTKNSRCINSAPFVGHITIKTRSELVSEGYSEEEVAKFDSESGLVNSADGNTNSFGANRQTMKQIRWRDEGGELTEDYAVWANEPVKVTVCYPLIDFDNDGIAERRYIVKIGQKVMVNEPYDHVPYAVMSALPEAHKAIGGGRAQLALEDQKVKTVLKRQLLDNIYMVNNPRIAASDRVDIDDLLDVRLNGVVRVDKGGIPSQEVFPLVTPYIGQSALQVIQYVDSARAARSGTIMDSQGLESDNLHKETATRFNGVEKAAEAKMELVARNIAEIGYRKLYDGICWTLQQFHDDELSIMSLGKEIKTRPSAWRYDHQVVSTVGLGAGTGDATIQSMMGLFQLQQQLKAQGSPLVDDKDVYNTLDKIVMAIGAPRTSDYFNDPAIPEDMMMAQLEKVTMALMQSQQIIEQLQSQQNPLAEAEMVKARASLVEANGRAQIEAAKIEAKREQDQLEMMQKARMKEADMQLDYTELELKYGVDVPGQGQGN